MKFHMIGDSHTSSFNGLDNYMTHDSVMKYFQIWQHIPAQAYEIGLEETPFSVYYFDAIPNIPTNEVIIPVVGEIDCRVSIARRCVKERYTVEESVGVTMDLFEHGLKKTMRVNKNIALLSPFTPHVSNEEPGFFQGDLDLVHSICHKYDEMLSEIADRYKLPHFSITKQLIDEEMWKDVSIYTDNWCHLRGEFVRGLLKSAFEKIYDIDITERR